MAYMEHLGMYIMAWVYSIFHDLRQKKRMKKAEDGG